MKLWNHPRSGAPNGAVVWTISLTVLGSIVSAGILTPARAVDPQVLQQKQEDQQRARGMARDLISSTLDIQLQQLEENGLEKMQVYRDIQTMRGNIHGLVESEMAQVVEILIEAQSATQEERERQFVKARRLIREIVVRLSIERQNLLRRLKTAEITEQVRRLIQMQTAVMNVAQSLPSESTARQEQLAIKAIEDQRDVRQLFLQLIETLGDVRTWDGPLAIGAADGLRILKAAEVGSHLDDAGRTLEATAYSEAVDHQAAVLRGLQQLLKILHHTQGLIGTDTQAALDRLHELEERQQDLREQTQGTAPNDPPDQQLVEQQSQIRSDLAGLSEQLQDVPAAETHLEQAKAAAFEAAAELFETRRSEALAEQGKVLGHLAALQEILENAGDLEASDKNAAEYAQLVQDLEAVKADLEQAKQKQQQASRTAESDPAEAAGPQTEVAEQLAQATEQRELPASVRSRLAEAEELAQAAADALKEAGDEPTPASEYAVESSEEALERAASEVGASLAEMKRREAAVQIGELARASDALERAAATERQIAGEAGEAAKNGGLDADESKRLIQQQAEVEDIARKVAEGLESAVPAAAKALAKSLEETQAVTQHLTAAEESPGEPSKPAAQSAARKAQSAAGTLTEAAAELRRELQETADGLARMTGGQLEKLSDSRGSVEQALAERPESVADRLKKLASAKEQVDEAAIAQQQASGRPQAAEAMQLAARVAAAQKQQQAAEQAAHDFAQGKTDTPLDATSKQQETADLAGELADESAQRLQAKQAVEEGTPDELTEFLKQAEQAAGEAAKQMLDGKVSLAERSRQESTDALRKAWKLAQAEMQQAFEAPPTAVPDAAAQQQVVGTAGEAQESAAADAPAAAETLGQAGEAAGQAGAALEAGESRAAAEAQADAAHLLQRAGEEITRAMQQLAEEESRQLTMQAEQTAALAQQTAAVDPGATAALRAAEKAARESVAQAAQAGNPHAAASPGQAAAAQAVGRHMEQAAATLAAREQQVRRDQAVAQALADLATQQQQSADDIATHSADLAELAPRGRNQPVDSAAMSPEQQQAARSLAAAAEQFAEAQRATEQGAVELSGQEQVANLPIREAHELASNLPVDWLPDLGAEKRTQEDERPVGQPEGAAVSADATGSGNSTEAALARNPEPPDRPVQADSTAEPTGESRTADAGRGEPPSRSRSFREAPWFARLPPEIRNAIRANSDRRPPRAYEERLQRYFESVE